MDIRSDATRWGSLARFFHWSIVALILVQATLGLSMVAMKKTPSVIPYYTFHKSLGLTILLLAIARLAWRAFDRRPDGLLTIPRWQALAARAGHALLYGLLFAVPLSGWLFDSASGLRPLDWWGLIRMPSLTGGPDAQLKEFGQVAHKWLFFSLAAVASGHAAVALIHHFINRDNTLRRMLPGGRKRAIPPSPNPDMSR